MPPLLTPALVVQLRKDAVVEEERLIRHFLHVRSSDAHGVGWVGDHDLVRDNGRARVVTREGHDWLYDICRALVAR